MSSANGDTEAPAPDRLEKLIAKATALYGMKDYTAAADAFSEATELQAEVNGEMSVDNADLLYSYGRCLFFVAQKTSTVLGGTATQAQLAADKEKKAPKKKAKMAQGTSTQSDSKEVPTATSSIAIDTPTESGIAEDPQKPAETDQPLFQISGDGNWTDSDDEEGDEEHDEADEEEDDFANSFELLDLARILYLRKLDGLQQSTAKDIDKGEYVPSIDQAAPVREVKSRIADIYDLQAEIGLEGEKFTNAVADLKACLALKEELEDPESSILAECHYKLSLALEAAAQEQQRDVDGNPVGDITINWPLRNEAVSAQEKAIECCKLRVRKETEKLEAIDTTATKERDVAMSEIEDVQEMIGEMEDRLTELRKPPVSIKAETEKDVNRDLMVGVLGQIMGAAGANTSKEEQMEQLAKVVAGANDLSGMVKRKKPQTSKPEASSATTTNGHGIKRKVEFADEVASKGATGSKEKRAKVEDAPDSGT